MARLEWETGRLAGAKAVKLELAGETPKGVKAPKGANFGFAVADLAGNKKLAIAVDATSIWLDLNLNGDLSDDRPLAAKAGTAWRHKPSVAITKDLSLVLEVYRSANCGADHIHFYTAMHRQGTVVLAGRVRLVKLADGNGDLRFNHADDPLYIDFNGDGSRSACTSAWFPASRSGCAGRATLRTCPTSEGSTVTFRRSDAVLPAPAVTPRKWSATRLEQTAAPGEERRRNVRGTGRAVRERAHDPVSHAVRHHPRGGGARFQGVV